MWVRKCEMRDENLVAHPTSYIKILPFYLDKLYRGKKWGKMMRDVG